MQKSTIKAFLAILFFTVVTSAFAESKETGKDNQEFDAAELIFHHIGDTHSFHVAGDFSIPLPVILWTNNGLVTFMSSEFHHDIDGKTIVERKGMQFVNLHDKIYQLNEGAAAVDFDAEHHPTNATRPLDFSITKNVFSMLLSFVVLALIFIASG